MVAHGVKKNNFEMALKVGNQFQERQYSKNILFRNVPAATHIKQGMDKIEKNDTKALSTLLKFL